jgi:hypothetical protein
MQFKPAAKMQLNLCQSRLDELQSTEACFVPDSFRCRDLMAVLEASQSGPQSFHMTPLGRLPGELCNRIYKLALTWEDGVEIKGYPPVVVSATSSRTSASRNADDD